MHRHSTNAVIQFIQMENRLCTKKLLGPKWAISGGTFTFASPNQNVGGRVAPSPPYNGRPLVIVLIFWGS